MQIADFEQSCETGRDIFETKNAEYGDSIEETGVLGAVVECIAKVARLRQLVLRNSEHGRQDFPAVRDSLLDLHNYAAIAMYMLRQDNWEGK